MSTTKSAIQSNFDSGDRLWFKIGALAVALGIAVSFAANSLHPQQADPNNNPAVFAEYAADTGWIATHLLQALGSTLLLVVGGLAIYHSLGGETGAVKGLARLGMAMALVAATVYIVDMGVDGVALKRAVDAWAGAAVSDKSAYFAVAEGIRWLEYGVLGFAGEFQGITALFLALGMAMSAVYPKWIGWLGVIGSLVFTIPGISIFWAGFTPIQQVAAQIGFFAIIIWFVAVAVRLWRLK